MIFYRKLDEIRRETIAIMLLTDVNRERFDNISKSVINAEVILLRRPGSDRIVRSATYNFFFFNFFSALKSKIPRVIMTPCRHESNYVLS